MLDNVKTLEMAKSLLRGAVKVTRNLVPRAFPTHFFKGKALGTRLRGWVTR